MLLAWNIFLTIVLLGLPLAMQAASFVSAHRETHTYLAIDDKPTSTQAVQAYASFYLLNNSFIPLDLVVLIDLAKLIYTFWIENDVNLLGIKVQNFSLHDDLAQIEYLFCDKTGTLTQNELRFKGICLRDGPILSSPRAECADQENMDMFLRCICLCHDLTRVHLNGNSFLTGSSQDELVLCEMVEDQKMGCFVEKDSDFMTIEVCGRREKWKQLKCFEFSSERKMMSRIVQNAETGQVVLFTKGADNTIIPKCVHRYPNIEDAVDKFANLGFRTLTFGFREFQSAAICEELLQEELEKSFELIAASGVEDLLQLDVKQCLSQFKRAEIKTWMLTGDKGETARQIGVSCGLISQESCHHHESGDIRLVHINEDSVLNISRIEGLFQKRQRYELMISGKSLSVLLTNHQLTEHLFEVLSSAESVLVYRASPAQKAEVVKFIRRHSRHKITVAIGDGANDVNMIQTAHLGIGIMGKEGNQAASFAEYAVAEFRSARRLIFWHGRSFGARTVDYMCSCVFKSMCFSNMLWMYNVNAGYSGLQSLDDIYYT